MDAQLWLSLNALLEQGKWKQNQEKHLKFPWTEEKVRKGDLSLEGCSG